MSCPMFVFITVKLSPVDEFGHRPTNSAWNGCGILPVIPCETVETVETDETNFLLLVLSRVEFIIERALASDFFSTRPH